MTVDGTEGGLVEVGPTLNAIIDVAGATDRGEVGLVANMHGVVADVAIQAFIAGAYATAQISDYYDSPEAAVRRLTFRAELAALDLTDRDRLTTHPAEVAALIDSTPSVIPFDPSKCTPKDGFTDEHRKSWRDLTRSLVENFKLCNDSQFSAIAAELGYAYGRVLQKEGIEGIELLHRVKAFEVKQIAIMRKSVETGELRQPDMDDHAFEHYLEDTSRACEPVWKAYSAQSRNRKRI